MPPAWCGGSIRPALAPSTCPRSLPHLASPPVSPELLHLSTPPVSWCLINPTFSLPSLSFFLCLSSPTLSPPCRPPELITEGILTKAADVYAFGVITWEIYVGRWVGGRAGGRLVQYATVCTLWFACCACCACVITWEIYVGRWVGAAAVLRFARCGRVPRVVFLELLAAPLAALPVPRPRLFPCTGRAIPLPAHRLPAACPPPARCLPPCPARCRRAWEGLKPTEVLRKVASNTRLEFPTQTPHRLKVRGDSCTALHCRM